METESKGCYKWDDELILSDPHFGRKLNNHNYELNVNNSAFPSDFILATFSELAYDNEDFSLPRGWKLLTTATNQNLTNGYFGVAFWNPSTCQIVVAHRGTKLSNLGALLSDLKLMLKRKRTGQSQSAATFVHIVSEEIKNGIAKKCYFQLSITGHSLGAWLGQITTFTVKYFKREDYKFVEDLNYFSNIHTHTVVFESPGCRQALEKLVEFFVPKYSNRKYGNYESLDMTVYLSQLNPINSVNEHVGTVYMVKSQTHSIKDIVNLFDPITSKIDKEQILDFQSGLLASSLTFFQGLFHIGLPKSLKKIVNDEEYSLNVFNEEELDFVKDWYYVINMKFPKILQFKHEQHIHDFKLDYDCNVIKGESICKTIASIKRLRPSKNNILELLKSDGEIKTHYEIFKLKTQLYQNNLVRFHPYYFNDKYGLKEFLKSKEQILHICIKTESKFGYDLETNIFNNVCEFLKETEPSLAEVYFKPEKHGFLNWNKLHDVLNLFPDIFSIYNINFLIIECFDLVPKNKKFLDKFLETNTVKLVILSTDKFSWSKENLNLVEVEGFGSNIQFQDLTENSQEKLITCKTLKLHKQELSLNDMINAEFPLKPQIYKHLNRVLPAQTLIEHMMVRVTELLEIHCPFNSIYKGIDFELYREVDVRNYFLQPNEQTLFLVEGDINENVAQTLLMNLNSEGNMYVKVEKVINFEKECLENFDKTIYFFTIKSDKLFLTSIFNKEFYISRRFVQMNHLSPDIFTDLSEEYEQFYVCGDENRFNQYLSKQNNDKFKFILSEEQAKRKISYSKAWSHLLKVEGNNILWLFSRGDIKTIRKYLQPLPTYIEEEQIMDNNLAIISGDPGIGKSLCVGFLYLKLQMTHWVFVIPLKNMNVDNLKEINYDNAAEFVLTTSSTPYTGYLLHLLSYCLKHKTNWPLCFLFDGFDEIYDKDGRKYFITLTNFLKYSCHVKILITTRSYKCKVLENRISAFASNFEMFNNNTEQVNYLMKFWRLIQESVDDGELSLYATTMLKNACNIFGETISDLIGIPLMLRMLAEVVAPHTTLQITFNNIIDLFEKYTKHHYNIYIKKTGAALNNVQKDWLMDYLTMKLCKLATIKLLSLDNDSIRNKDIEELNIVGIIQSEPNNKLYYNFYHDSIRDYFVAYYLKMWLESTPDFSSINWNIVTFITTDLFLNQQYGEVRFFLNLYMTKCPITTEKLEICQKKVQKLWIKDKNYFYDNQECIFHVCIKEYLYSILKHFLFKVIEETTKVELFCKRDFDLQTPLFLALSLADAQLITILLKELSSYSNSDIKSVILSTLFVHFISVEHIDALSKYSEDYPKIQNSIREVRQELAQINLFLNSCASNNTNQLQEVLQRYQNDVLIRNYLLQSTNAQKETGLHLTTSKEIANRLIKLNANKNSRDCHGITPLARATKRGNIAVATLLIDGGADTTISDFIGYSPLSHAAKHGHLDIAKLLIKSKTEPLCEIDHCNAFNVTPLMLAAKNGHESFVQFLISKGANVNATDWNGMTPVYHAVKGNHTPLIKIFKHNNANLNIQDENEITPLLYSIMRSRNTMVISLLDSGADVNIGSERNGYPLQLLIKKDKQQIIKKILKKDIKKNKDGTIIIRQAAKLDILTDEELQYIENLKE